MKKNIIIVGVVGLLLSSCVSQKRYSDLESLQQNTKELLDSATAKLGATETQLSASSERLNALSEQNKFLRANNQDLINNIGNLTTLTQKGAENLERSLESIKEKDLVITRMQDAVTRRDSVTLALVVTVKLPLLNNNLSEIDTYTTPFSTLISISSSLRVPNELLKL